MKYYCDGSTYKNGQKGQDSSYIILKPSGKIIRKHLGNCSVNCAELRAIIHAFKICDLGEEIFSDSTICVNWINKPYKKNKRNAYLEPLILEAQDLLHTKGLSLKYIRREFNLAGLELEENPFYSSAY